MIGSQTGMLIPPSLSMHCYLVIIIPTFSEISLSFMVQTKNGSSYCNVLRAWLKHVLGLPLSQGAITVAEQTVEQTGFLPLTNMAADTP